MKIKEHVPSDLLTQLLQVAGQLLSTDLWYGDVSSQQPRAAKYAHPTCLSYCSGVQRAVNKSVRQSSSVSILQYGKSNLFSPCADLTVSQFLLSREIQSRLIFISLQIIFLGRFCDILKLYSHTSILYTLLRHVLSVTFCGAVVMKVMDQKTRVKRR